MPDDLRAEVRLRPIATALPLGFLSFAIGMVLAAVAAYTGLALLVEDVRGHDVLPVFRRGPATEAMRGPAAAQLARLAHEPGAREQL